MTKERCSHYGPERRVETFRYGEGEARYRFTALDPVQPVPDKGEPHFTEEYLFTDFDQALEVYQECIELDCLVGPLMDNNLDIALLEQWLPKTT